MSMRKIICILSLLAVVAGSLLHTSGCYNDRLIRERLDQFDIRLQALEKLCAEMNTNISSMQQIITALQNNDFVTDILPIVENGKEIGYTLTFSKSGTVTIYHGHDGADGEDGKDGTDGKDGANGSTPVIGIQQDDDGAWYWTLNGEWLLDDQGEKVRASAIDGKDGEDGKDGKNGKNGADAIIPQLKIKNDYWYISYDDRQTWERLGRAIGEDGEDGIDGEDGKDGVDGIDGTDGTSFFKSVVVENNSVVLTLMNNTVITIPKALSLSVTFSDLSASPHIDFNTVETIEAGMPEYLYIGYSITSSADTVVVEAVASSDLGVLIERKSKLEGRIVVLTSNIKPVDAFTRLTILISDEKNLLMRSYRFKEKK